MRVSSFQYYNDFFLTRFLVQKHFRNAPVVTDIFLRVSNNKLSTIEDPEIVRALHTLELLSGRKAKILKQGSRYVGTSKKSFFSVGTMLPKSFRYPFIEALSYFFLIDFQKREGLWTIQRVKRGSFTICCKDIQLFEQLYLPIISSNLLITFRFSPNYSKGFFELLKAFKFHVHL
jgi:hypothetical protein